MGKNPFVITKAEEFNHSYELLASLMEFQPGVADVLLSNTNVIIEGSRGSGKSMYLRMLSLAVKTTYEALAASGDVDPLPEHEPFVGVYAKLNPTLFGPNEYELQHDFQPAFRELFNVYCIESLLGTIVETLDAGRMYLGSDDKRQLVRGISEVALSSVWDGEDVKGLLEAMRRERRRCRHALETQPLVSDARSQPDVLWEAAEVVSRLSVFEDQRVHFLVDEYDALSVTEQRILNSYLRKRDFPVTFKIACKKHRLTLDDVLGNPLNPSGDYHRVELDDDEFGSSTTYSTYVAAIANKRLRREGYQTDIGMLLGPNAKPAKTKAQIRYGGLKTVTMLSSGIVRTFLELCRDIFGESEMAKSTGETAPIPAQDRVIRRHADNRWSGLARDQSARVELQHLIEQIAAFFRLKAAKGKEKQIIRLEIIDFNRTSNFLRGLLNQALEYEALVQPNRERLQKNRKAASRGYLLHRLLCVHFRLEPTSRWDAEINAAQLEALVLGDYKTTETVVKNPTRMDRKDDGGAPLLTSLKCPITGEDCPRNVAKRGLGFLSCRLPNAGHIRDAIQLLKDTFRGMDAKGGPYELKTAEDYPAQGDIACKVCHAVAESEFVLVEFSRQSPNVAMELGLAIARQKPTFILFNTDEQPSVPEPFSSLEYFPYAITPNGVRELVESRLIPQLSASAEWKPLVSGSEVVPLAAEGKGVFVALPEDRYHQELVLPKIKDWLEGAGLGPVVTEQEGQALQDLTRAVKNIAAAKYCLIDTTNGATTRAMYLGLAQGYRKPFANLVDKDSDPDMKVFTNAKSKSEVGYSDAEDLVAHLDDIFVRFGIER